MAFDSIRTRLLLGFLLLSPLPLAGLAWVYSAAFERSLNDTVLSQLSSLADKKTDQINTYLDERLADGHLLAKSATTFNILRAPADHRAAEQQREYFRTLFDDGGYYDLLLIDAAGNVVFSILGEPDLGTNLDTGPYRDTTLAHAHRAALGLLDTQITPTASYPPSGDRPAIFLVTPVIDAGRPLGSVALQLDLERLTAVTADATGLGESGETVLAQLTGGAAAYVGPLRRLPNAAFHHRVPLRQIAAPMHAALAGGHGRGPTVDYAGVPIVAAWRHLPALRWGMVVKMDAAEALAPARQLRAYATGALALLVLAAGATAWLFGRALLGSIRQLLLATGRIAAGDLNHYAPLDGCAEFRQLARSFNEMADRIREEQATLERRVAGRTAELQHSTARYDELTARIPVGVYTLRNRADGSMAFEYVSERFCRLLEVEAAAVLADAAAAFARVHPDDLDDLLQRNAQVARTLQPLRWEGRCVIADAPRWFLVESAPLPLPNGDSLWNGAISDVTERRLAQQALQESERFLRNLTDIVPGMVGYWDTELRCGFANAAYQAWFGRTPEQMRGIRIQDLMGEALFRKNEPYIRAALRGEPQDFERTLTKADGSTGYTWAHYIPDRDGERVRGFFVLVSDITALKEAQLRLEQLNAELRLRTAEAEAASRAKSEFLANMSHEIRTPMNAILGLTRLVLETDLNPQQQDFLQKAHSSAKALLGILNDILDYSKIEAGRLELEHTPFVLERLLGDVADLFSAKVAEKGLELFLEIDPRVPPQAMGDPLRLTQVLNNLVGNAVKFTRRGEVHVKVEPAGGNGESMTLRFAVRDTGIGLSKAQVAQLFQPFTQADGSITRQFGGTGLGLTISRRLVGLMGGEITASGEEGVGATFTFTIRVGRVPAGPVATGPVAADLRRLAGSRVLVVDDQETSRQILGQLLLAWGLEVQTAASGEAALARIAATRHAGRPFDAVLLDWYMPGGLSGVEVARRLEQERAAGHPMLVIMVTAHDKERLLAEAGDTHLDGVLTKPVTPSALFDALVDGRGARPVAPLPAALNLAEFRGARVLLVEDNAINQQVAEQFLARRGLTVVTANHGGEAVEWVRRERFDAVLMDLHMPVMSGLEATRLIRDLPNGQDLPVIAMTAAVMQEDRDRCIDVGMVDFIAKPVDPDELTAVLRRWVRPVAGAAFAPPAAAPLPAAPELPATLAGFDLDQTLQRIDGNRDLLARLLRLLVQEQAGAATRVAALLEAGDRTGAAIVLHTLKGVAANLSATELTEAARRTELEVKAGGAVPSLPALSATLAAAVAAVGAALPPPAAPPPADGAQLTALLRALEPYLHESELIPVELLQALRRQADGTPPGTRLARLMHQIDQFDHTGALESIARLTGEAAGEAAGGSTRTG